MKKVLLHALALICLVSCAGLTQVSVPQSTINFIDKDMETERFVEYTLVKTYFLGIGGMSEKARNTNIIDELMKKANLQDNEVLAYITVSKNINQFLIVTDITYTASGYVVRPKEGNYKDAPQVNMESGGHLVVNTANDEGPNAKEQKQLYDTYKRRINHALTAEDIIKIKKDIEKEVVGGNMKEDLAKDLYKKIAQWLDN